MNDLAAQPRRSLDELIARLSALHPSRISLGLERMLAQLDHPERKLPPVIHVAGTNGKGSTVAYLRAMLEAAGLRVHVFTSPWLVRINESYRLGKVGGGVLVDDDELISALLECERVNAGAPITFFEVKTVAAFLLFAQHPADVVLLEVGLGGRLDSTNVIDQVADQHGPYGIPWRHARTDRRRKSRHHQARLSGDLGGAGVGCNGRD